jgi:hypothetical protein
MAVYRYLIPQRLIFVVGFLVALAYFWTTPETTFIGTTLEGWAGLLAMVTVALGTYSLIVRHGRIIISRESRWYTSLTCLITFAAFLIVGGGLGMASDVYIWLNHAVFDPLHAMSDALPLFASTIAMYHALRVRNRQSLFVVALVALSLYGRSPLGPVTPIIYDAYSWLQTIGAMGPRRGLAMVMGIGAFAMALRTMLGLERRIRAE